MADYMMSKLNGINIVQDAWIMFVRTVCDKSCGEILFSVPNNTCGQQNPSVFLGKNIRSVNLLHIIDAVKESSDDIAKTDAPQFNPFINDELYRKIGDFEISVVGEGQQKSNLSEGSVNNVVFCAPGVSNCNVVILKNEREVCFFHISPYQRLQVMQSECIDYLDFLLYKRRSDLRGEDSVVFSKFASMKQELSVLNFCRLEATDNFTKNTNLYNSYNCVHPYKFQYPQTTPFPTIESDQERFTVFFDTSTNEALCINKVGRIVFYPHTE